MRKNSCHITSNEDSAAAQQPVQPAEQRDDLVEARTAEQRRLAARRLRPQPQHQARDDAERALGADEQLLEVVAGVVLEHPVQRRDHGAVGKHGFEAEHHLAHHAVADHAVAAGVGRRVTADRGGAARTEVEREHQALPLRGLLHRGKRGTRLHHHRPAGPVDGFDAVHALERQPDLTGPSNAALHKAGEPAHRHHRLPRRIAGGQNAGYLVSIGRAHDRPRGAGPRVGPARGPAAHRSAGQEAVWTDDFRKPRQDVHGRPF